MNTLPPLSANHFFQIYQNLDTSNLWEGLGCTNFQTYEFQIRLRGDRNFKLIYNYLIQKYSANYEIFRLRGEEITFIR